MTIFVDTSALYALLNDQDKDHHAARAEWAGLSGRAEGLLTTNYVLTEAVSLLQHRRGIRIVVSFQADLVPALSVLWVDENLHARGGSSLLTANRRDLSLVDCVSFESMREHGLTTAFAFDAHFAEQGFQVIPAVAPR
jgi:predicted nucleic acid-binding protein